MMGCLDLVMVHAYSTCRMSDVKVHHFCLGNGVKCGV